MTELVRMTELGSSMEVRTGCRLELDRRDELEVRMELRQGAEFEVRTKLEREQGKRFSLLDLFIIDSFDRLRYLCCVETYVSSLFCFKKYDLRRDYKTVVD